MQYATGFMRGYAAYLRRAIGVLTIIGASLLSGWAGAAPPQKGGVLTVGLEADFPGFDPLQMGALVERMVAMSFYETLMEISEEGEIIPHLAESLTASEGGAVYTLKLRPGIRFHDGTPLDANAVVFNLRRLIDPANTCRCQATVADIASVDAGGPDTVIFKLRAPNAAFPAVLADVPGMQASPTAIRKVEADGGKYGNAPVGTGPFRFIEWRRGVSMKVERNADYWQKDLPHLDGVVYRPIPDQQTRMASLTAGDIQLSVVPSAQDVASAKRGSRTLKLFESPALGTVFAMFNAQREPTNDARVRQALFHATDRALIVKTVNRDIYPVANQPFGPGLAAGRQDVSFPAYDPSKARALLAEYGKPVKFTFSVSATPDTLRLAQVLQQMWKKVGIEVEIEQIEQLQLIRKAIKNDFQGMHFRWPGRADPDLNTYQFFHSSSGRNYTRYNNPAMDLLLERGRSTLAADERLAIYHEVSELLAKDGPYLFLYPSTNFFLASSKVHDLPAIPDGLPRLGPVWLSK